jgi:hypothetical protein
MHTPLRGAALHRGCLFVTLRPYQELLATTPRLPTALEAQVPAHGETCEPWMCSAALKWTLVQQDCSTCIERGC